MLAPGDLPALTSDESRRLDRIAIDELGIPAFALMENAGNALARHCLEALKELPAARVVVLCGTGNNGGDGLVCARHLADRVDDLRVFQLGSGARFRTRESRLNLDLLSSSFAPALEIDSAAALSAALPEPPWLGVDCVFGTGLVRPIEGFRADCLELFDREARLKVAADVPSGLSADTGEVLGIAPHCDLTVTFMTPNKGHFAPDAADRVGRLIVDAIGLPPEWIMRRLR